MAKLCVINFILFLFIQQSCQNSIDLQKCCPYKHHLRNDECVQTPFEKDFSEFVVYDKNRRRTNEKFQDVFNVVVSNATRLLDMTNFETVYLVHDGSLHWSFEPPNSFPRVNILTNLSFCLDYSEDENSTNSLKPGFWLTDEQTLNSPSMNNNYFIISALLISCIFLIIVIVVYLSLPELRNFSGMVLMGCVTSILGAFLSLVATRLKLMGDDAPTLAFCYAANFIVYFFFMSSFCWMNVMAFQMWRSFRKMVKHERRTKRREVIVFTRCCLYAWGLPLLLSTFVITIDNLDLTDLPWFIKPNIPSYGCLINGKEKLIYLYVPMMILLMLNWIFFLLTAYNLWLLYDNGHILKRQTRLECHKKRLLLFLKISVIMGISWILEVISAIYPTLDGLWYITDTYNMLIGFAFFIIFACRKKIWIKILRRKNVNTNSIRLESLNPRNTAIKIDETNDRI